MRRRNYSQLYSNLSIDSSSRQVVGDGPLSRGDIRHPIVAVDVGYAEKVQAVNAQPNIPHS